MTNKAVLEQLSKPQRVVVKVCEDNWNRIKESCSDNGGKTCGVTGRNCSFSKCPKLEEKREEEEDEGKRSSD